MWDWSFEECINIYNHLYEQEWFDNWMIAEIGRQDRFFLLVYLLNRKDVAHPWLYDRCRMVQADPEDHLDLWARFHYKSTIITFGGIIQEIINNPNTTIAILSNSKKVAKPFLEQIKNELTMNAALKALYPEIIWENPDKDAPKWSMSEGIIVKRTSNPKESTVEAYGLIDGMPTGRHFDLLVYDDVVTEESVNTPDQLEKTLERLELSYNLGSTHHLRRWMIGTRYAYVDTYQVVMDRGSFKPRIYPATDDGRFDGKAVFLDERRWEEIKRDTSQFVVACQQLLNPIAGSELAFDPEWIREYEVRPYLLNVAILVDPASSKNKNSDRTAMAVVGIDVAHNYYLLDGVCHRMALSERWETLKGLYTKWLRQPGINQVKVGYERYGMQSDIEHFQDKMRRPEEPKFGIDELAWPREGPGSKTDRVQRLEPIFRNWRFYVPYRGGSVTKLQKEYIDKGQKYMLSKPIRKLDENRKTYDLVDWFIKNEYYLFPAIHPDFLDATSRIFDINLGPPKQQGEDSYEPEAVANY